MNLAMAVSFLIEHFQNVYKDLLFLQMETVSHPGSYTSQPSGRQCMSSKQYTWGAHGEGDNRIYESMQNVTCQLSQATKRR